MTEPLDVYGKPDCADYQRSRACLADLGVAHRFHDITADPGARAEAERLSGGERSPVVIVGERVLVEPSDDELRTALGR